VKRLACHAHRAFSAGQRRRLSYVPQAAHSRTCQRHRTTLWIWTSRGPQWAWSLENQKRTPGATYPFCKKRTQQMGPLGPQSAVLQVAVAAAVL